jgi:hypothetical protein
MLQAMGPPFSRATVFQKEKAPAVDRGRRFERKL